MYDYLISTMKRLCEEGGYIQHASRNLFYEGVTDRLVQRLRLQRRIRERDEQRKKEEARARGEQINALVLTDVYGSEADLNNDALNGFAPGTTARARTEKITKEIARKELEAQFIAQGIDKIVAFYLSYGQNMERALESAAAYHHKVQREQRRVNHTGFTRHERRDHNRRSSSAYRAGARVGDEIGLDTQLTRKKQDLLG
jgi:hypothetical protein